MTSALLPLAILASVWTGACIVRGLWPGGPGRRGAMPLMIKSVLALAIGWAVTAGHYLAWRAIYPQFEVAYRLVDCLLIPGLAWWGMVMIRRRWRTDDLLQVPAPAPLLPGRIGTRILLATALAVAAGGLLVTAGHAWYEPLGQWDGWAIWNLKARFFHRDGGNWTGMFSHEIWFSHPDYPLLLPGSIARLWFYLGHETTLVPQLTSVGYTALVMALLFASLAYLRGLTHACAGLLLLAGSETFLFMGGAQYADVPLSLYLLGSLLALAIGQRLEHGRDMLFVLAGVLAGGGAMMKNEGLVFALVLLAAVLVGGRRAAAGRRRMVAMLLIGMAPALMVVAGQKLFLAGESYLTADQDSSRAVLDKALDGSRYRMIFVYLLDWNFGLHGVRPVSGLNLSIPLPQRPEMLLLLAVAAIFGLRPAARDRFTVAAGLIAIALLALAYFAVYVVMPYDLYNLLETSVNRLHLHFWPSLIFLVLLATRAGMEHNLPPRSFP
jgi:hypothetical protein